ncbi:MAG: hypothetical protein LC662_01775 [Rhodothermaceae bacterium]|nr:hypothetical protein [Rhodothermaceae bacterium]
MAFLVILIATLLIQFVLPWWCIVFPGFFVGIILAGSGREAFFSGFLAVSLIWWIYTILLNTLNYGILLDRLAVLFPVPGWGIILIGGLIGGSVTGLATLTGFYIRRAAI